MDPFGNRDLGKMLAQSKNLNSPKFKATYSKKLKDILSTKIKGLSGDYKNTLTRQRRGERQTNKEYLTDILMNALLGTIGGAFAGGVAGTIAQPLKLIPKLRKTPFFHAGALGGGGLGLLASSIGRAVKGKKPIKATPEEKYRIIAYKKALAQLSDPKSNIYRTSVSDILKPYIAKQFKPNGQSKFASEQTGDDIKINELEKIAEEAFVSGFIDGLEKNAYELFMDSPKMRAIENNALSPDDVKDYIAHKVRSALAIENRRTSRF